MQFESIFPIARIISTDRFVSHSDMFSNLFRIRSHSATSASALCISLSLLNESARSSIVSEGIFVSTSIVLPESSYRERMNTSFSSCSTADQTRIKRSMSEYSRDSEPSVDSICLTRKYYALLYGKFRVLGIIFL